MAKARHGDEYHTYFDPKTFLDLFYKNFKDDESGDVFVLPFIKALHEFWSNFNPTAETANVRYLEFGGGPSIMNLVVACPKVDHIVFAEYTEANRQAVKSWIAGESKAHDWTPLIEFVLTLEKNKTASTEKEKLALVLNRAEELKRKVKSVIPCDATKTPIVQLNTNDVAKLFDVVTTSLCLEVCALSEVHYKDIVAKLVKFLKPNGYLFMNGVLGQTFYFVDKEKFYTFPLTEKMVREAMNEAGIEIEKFVTIPVNYSDEECDCKAIYYTYGRKSAEK